MLNIHRGVHGSGSVLIFVPQPSDPIVSGSKTMKPMSTVVTRVVKDGSYNRDLYKFR